MAEGSLRGGGGGGGSCTYKSDIKWDAFDHAYVLFLYPITIVSGIQLN